MPTEMMLIVTLVAVIAGALGYFISHSRNASALAAQRQQAADTERQLQASKSELQQQAEALRAATASLQSRETELAVALQQVESTTQRGEQINQECSLLKTRLDEEQRALSQKEQELSATEAKLQAAQARESERVQQVESLEQEVRHERERVKAVEAERNGLKEELATLRTTLEKEHKHTEAKLKDLEENKQILKQEFENLANQIFEAKGKAFSQQSTESLNMMLTPFREQLESFRKRVDEVHTHQAEGQATLRTELGKLHELNQRITDEAANLTRALKGDKKKQGNWGELQVEMILDQSGLRKGREYDREANFKAEDDNNLRPDFIVHLPEGKHAIIDSKVSLIDYTAYVAAETDEEREACLKRHVQAVRNHISSLSAKDYAKMKGINSPDFVFMFMPIEPAFMAAFEYDHGLFNAAFEKQIVVVTPTTLLATLRTIANLWSIERQNQSARILADQAARVYDKLRVFVEKMDKLGGQIATVQKTYDDAHNTLAGSRSLTSTVQKFVDLGVRVRRELPATVTESALLDDEVIGSLEHQIESEGEVEEEVQA